MTWVDPSVEEISQISGNLVSIQKHIELAGRTSYKSFDKMSENSHERFFNMLTGNKHGTPLEFGTVYLNIPYMSKDTREEVQIDTLLDFFEQNPYSRVNYGGIGEKPVAFVTTNMRVIEENKDYLLGECKIFDYLSDPTKDHSIRRTFRVVCSIGTSRELNRHRTLSIVEQSTRYCNYSHDKFNGDITFIKGCGFSKETRGFNEMMFEKALEQCTYSYMALIQNGCKPQEARSVLPLATATEVCYCAFEDDWEHFLSLRSPERGAGGVHPDAAIIGDKISRLLYVKLV